VTVTIVDPEVDNRRSIVDPFGNVLASLEDSLQIRLIASWDLVTCQSDELAPVVLARPEVSKFSQVPVATGTRIIGVLERSFGLQMWTQKLQTVAQERR
jgi:predicted transcriptional regulator